MATKHGRRHSTEYNTWAGMKMRCLNPNNPKYPRYGGRGITICAEWVADFGAFFNDMGPRPSPAHTLDRIDNDGNYEPSNCRWALPKAQSNNRSTTRQFTYKDCTGTLYDIAAYTGVPRRLLRFRLDLGWDLTRAVEQPAHADEHHVTFNGKTQSLAAWGRETGLGGACISERLRKGWCVRDALTLPKNPGRKLYKQEIS